MNKFHVRVQRGKMAETPEQAERIAQELLDTGAKELVIKAQVHAGGRGKGHFLENNFKSGVHIAKNTKAIRENAEKMIGYSLVTKQTTAEGQKVMKVLIHEGINFTEEKYFAIVLDRSYGGPVIIVSQEGGVDIEEVSEKNPEALTVIPIDIMKGIQVEQAERAAAALGFKGEQQKDAIQQITNQYRMFVDLDAVQIEVNPQVLATDGKIYCVDSKINFDDNAMYRHKDVLDMRDLSMEDPREVQAGKFNLNYIGQDGNIGCLVNGAGLAMATMDIIKQYGGNPANFLDVGGNAKEDQVEEAFRIQTSDSNVKAILVNIFGGIMKCDIIAAGIIAAAKNIKLQVPLIVRLEGTNVEQGIEMLKNSDLNIISAHNLEDAAIKAVSAIRK